MLLTHRSGALREDRNNKAVDDTVWLHHGHSRFDQGMSQLVTEESIHVRDVSRQTNF